MMTAVLVMVRRAVVSVRRPHCRSSLAPALAVSMPRVAIAALRVFKLP